MLLSSGVAGAELLNVAENGFSLRHEVTIDAPRAEVWRIAVDAVGQWWRDDHTMAGDAGQMSIDARPQGCFCESLGEKGGVVHLTVTFVNPNVFLRMSGALGPLGGMGVAGNMMWEFFDAGEGTTVKFSYVVGGYDPGGLEQIAGPVDFVVGDALLRLKAYVETGDADAAGEG